MLDEIYQGARRRPGRRFAMGCAAVAVGGAP
jgi:hypothetical protein